MISGPVLDALSDDDAIWDEIGVPHGPGRRITLGGQTVAGFHLFVTEDPSDPRPGALVVFGIDVWLDDFPEFVAAVDRALDRIARWPGAGALVDGVDPQLEVRRVPVERFPYSLA